MGYDEYYQTKSFFGEPYPELLAFYARQKPKGALLDLGCGQGRDALPLARLGYQVTGVDVSSVGIGQLKENAEHEGLNLHAVVADIYQYDAFEPFDFILLDSMFHFTKRDREKEVKFLKRIFTRAKQGALITVCIQRVGQKLDTLLQTIEASGEVRRHHQVSTVYRFKDQATQHESMTEYEIVTVKKGGAVINKPHKTKYAPRSLGKIREGQNLLARQKRNRGRANDTASLQFANE